MDAEESVLGSMMLSPEAIADGVLTRSRATNTAAERLMPGR
jgi:replicative DNA helicase